MLLCNSWSYFKPGQCDVSVKDIKLWMDVPSNLFYILTLEYFKQQRKKHWNKSFGQVANRHEGLRETEWISSDVQSLTHETAPESVSVQDC